MAVYYRDHRDWIAHLAIELTRHSVCELAVLERNNEKNDLLGADHKDLEEAGEMLKQAGVRTQEQPPPAWHFAVRSPCYVGWVPLPRVSKAEPTEVEMEATAGDVPL